MISVRCTNISPLGSDWRYSIKMGRLLVHKLSRAQALGVLRLLDVEANEAESVVTAARMRPGDWAEVR